MNRWYACVFAAFVLAIGSTSGCSKSKVPLSSGAVWRASNDYGDKPGNGIELTMEGKDISGRFFILEPEKPHNFDAGRAFPLRILERRATELVCEVRFNATQTDRFVLKLPESFPQNQFVATTHDREPGTTPIEFVFKRVK